MNVTEGINHSSRRLNSLRQVLRSEDTYATTLLIVFLDQFGIEALDWSPETIKLELQDEFQTEISSSTLDRLMAAITVVTTDDFYRRLPYFIQLCNVLSGDDLDLATFDPADASEIAWGMTEALLLFPPEDSNPFSAEIQHYIGQVVSAEGIVNPPDVLAIGLQETKTVDPIGDYADDPEMYSALYAGDQERVNEIKEMLQDNLRELFSQLKSLPLREGNTDDLLNRMRLGGVGGA